MQEVILDRITESERAHRQQSLVSIREKEAKYAKTWRELTCKSITRHKDVCITEVPFFLPQGDGPKSSTVHIYNLYYGPCAFRASTMAMEQLQGRIFGLNNILKKEASCVDKNDKDSEEIKNSLVDLCMEIGLFSEKPLDAPMDDVDQQREDWLENHKETILAWEKAENINIPEPVADLLGKTWIFLGSDIQKACEQPDLLAERAYIRAIGNEWAVGCPSALGMAEQGFNWLKRILEPFDVWLPCTMLDEDCCISDIPGGEITRVYTGLNRALYLSYLVLCWYDVY